MHIIRNQNRPLCEACKTAPAEINSRMTGWKKKCAACEHAVKLAADRARGHQKTARRRAARMGAQS